MRYSLFEIDGPPEADCAMSVKRRFAGYRERLVSQGSCLQLTHRLRLGGEARDMRATCIEEQ